MASLSKALTALIVTAALAIPSVAQADDLAAAKKHYERGTTLYDLGKYIDAAHEYEAAFDAHSDPALLFNIGQAYRLGGDNPSATRAYRSYLRRVPNAQNRAEVERLLQTMAAQPATSPVQSPAGAPTPAAKEPLPESAPTATTTSVGRPEVVTAQQEKTAPETKRPVYKRWWFWTIAGAVVAGGVVGAVVATTPNNAKAPAGAMTISFP